MQIGAFAELCKTKLSVLRHYDYDKEGILMPVYIDPITGYRHYAPQQAAVFRRITALKRAGFSLSEIRRVLSSTDSDAEILSLFAEKEASLHTMLSDLARAKEMMMEETMQLQVTFTEENGSCRAVSAYFDAGQAEDMKRTMDGALRASRYQRISGYRVLRDGRAGEARLSCFVLLLNEMPASVRENTDLPFVDDPLIVGRWDVVGEYAHRDDVPAHPMESDAAGHAENGVTSLYFLPGGAQYWCYAWTRGRLLCRYGDASYVCDYTTERIDGERYMFVEWKSYEYRCGGKPVMLVLRQHDSCAYTADALARKDDIDLPFEDDAHVIGEWRSVGMVSAPDAFDPTLPARQSLFFSRVTFRADGEVESVYGDKCICGRHMQVWTRGYILRKWNSTACAYEIRKICGTEYLFVEWKSGDYIWGGRDPMYYVFRRV